MEPKRSLEDRYRSFDYAKECLEYFHNNQYSNLCSDIELPNSRGEITFSKPNEPEEDNSILLLM